MVLFYFLEVNIFSFGSIGAGLLFPILFNGNFAFRFVLLLALVTNFSTKYIITIIPTVFKKFARTKMTNN